MTSTDTSQQPPSPAAQPPHPTAALGAEYNPFDPAFRANPHQFFDRARREAPVCFNPVFGMWLVTGYSEVMQVCTDTATFSSMNKVDPPNTVLPEVLEILHTEGFPVAMQLFNTDPPDHARLRSLVGQAFTNEVLDRFGPRVVETMAGYIEQWQHEDEVDLYPRFTNPMPLTIILDFIGVPRDMHEQVGRWDDAWARLFTSAHAIDDQLDAVRAVVGYQQYLNGLIDQRRAEPADDLISRCVHARRGDYQPLTNAELVWQIMGLLAAGHATTTDALSHLLLVLLSEPDRWQAVVADPGMLGAVVEEGLRLVNPVLGLPRITTREVLLGEVTLPAGAEVLVSFCAANRDEAFTANPGVFDPARTGVSRHLGFGWGVHQCIGARLSNLMLSSALGQLAARVPALRLAADYQPAFTEHPFLWGLSSLRVRPAG